MHTPAPSSSSFYENTGPLGQLSKPNSRAWLTGAVYHLPCAAHLHLHRQTRLQTRRMLVNCCCYPLDTGASALTSLANVAAFPPRSVLCCSLDVQPSTTTDALLPAIGQQRGYFLVLSSACATFRATFYAQLWADPIDNPLA